MAQIRSGGVPDEIKWTILLVSVLVLPVPAPATINRGEFAAFAARCCSGFRFGILEGISNIVGKMNSSSYKPLIVVVFLVAALVLAGAWSSAVPSQPGGMKVYGILSAPGLSPALVSVAQGADLDNSSVLAEGESAILNNTPDIGNQVAITEEDYADATIQDPGQPVGTTPDPSQEVMYTVKKGDTLSSIASHFNTSVANILAANPNLGKKKLQVGASITVPGAAAAVAAANSTLPNFNGDFVMPAQGYDYGVLDNYNGVVVGNSCGTPVVASAAGIVVPDPTISDTSGAWNGGYGNFVLIEHSFGNGVYTRYAHLEQVSVQIGDIVKQGQEIGLMGESGEASGCGVDFEVIGAQNPFAN
jgi:LysM repeat protein